jgi:hypothetical protein
MNKLMSLVDETYIQQEYEDGETDEARFVKGAVQNSSAKQV